MGAQASIQQGYGGVTDREARPRAIGAQTGRQRLWQPAQDEGHDWAAASAMTRAHSARADWMARSPASRSHTSQ